MPRDIDDLSSENCEQRGESDVCRLPLRVGPSLSSRLEDHLYLLKKIGGSRVTKQNWIIEAIREKLDRDVAESVPCQANKDRRMVLKLDPNTLETLKSRIDLSRRIGASYSKNKWVLEAIDEKLEKESKQTRRWLEALQSEMSSSETDL